MTQLICLFDELFECIVTISKTCDFAVENRTFSKTILNFSNLRQKLDRNESFFFFSIEKQKEKRNFTVHFHQQLVKLRQVLSLLESNVRQYVRDLLQLIVNDVEDLLIQLQPKKENRRQIKTRRSDFVCSKNNLFSCVFFSFTFDLITL